jgi:hypothetical protein
LGKSGRVRPVVFGENINPERLTQAGKHFDCHSIGYLAAKLVRKDTERTSAQNVLSMLSNHFSLDIKSSAPSAYFLDFVELCLSEKTEDINITAKVGVLQLG